MKKIPRIARIGPIGLETSAKPARVIGLDQVEVTGGGVRQLNLMPEQVRLMARQIGDERAQQIWRLMRKGVVGTVPELCAYSWLERRQFTFEFQSSQMGGRVLAGGAVVDFLIYDISPDGLYIWRVQGEYWHSGADVEIKDANQAQRLKRIRIGGVPVQAVVDLWENDIYSQYPEVFEMAEYGVGLREA